jgi:ribulose-5-phosphate 4-epimerase/fuculose-1-phosphate aldolase
LTIFRILDAYGHLSFRHPANPDIFVMPQNMAPANISSLNDLVQYKVADASAVQSDAPAGYIERYIHSEIYRKFPQVNSVIHSHASDVIPYSISGEYWDQLFHTGELVKEEC